MVTASPANDMVTFLPGLDPGDRLAAWWLRQVTIRLRREVCWLWRERTGRAADPELLPPLTDRLVSALDLSRYRDSKAQFFETDTAAGYLSSRLLDEPSPRERWARGSFGWAAESLGLDDPARFVLALALAAAYDGAIGAVFASCLNDSSRTQPTLGVAQRLWENPSDILAIADPSHALFRVGLIQRSASESTWDEPLVVPPLVARQLLFPDGDLPGALQPLNVPMDASPAAHPAPWAHIGVGQMNGTRIVPIRGPRGIDRDSTAAFAARQAGEQAVKLLPGMLQHDRAHVRALATVCWLRGVSLAMDSEGVSDSGGPLSDLVTPPTIPLTLFVGTVEKAGPGSVPAEALLPPIDVRPLTFYDRVLHWERCLGPSAAGLEPAIAECSRRFRFERGTIESAARSLHASILSGVEPRIYDLIAACRAEISHDMGDLAQPVIPRFGADELVLPPKQERQFDDICRAMSALTAVHYGWGTARVWNESGIAALFAGPPGTGKTMAAEVLAARLDLPMYRIDLSQVVNKYIGETEKNLKRVFDAADRSDTLLFFDEADALFGRRTEVKDAHDRYANLEISYLLERMERFKGLAILATNRKKDLDEAFLRRLRFVIDFPLPEAAQRRQIWQQVIPECVDTRDLDFDFLAKQFQLAGAHIRSIVFNACLQAAHLGEPRLTMEQILICVRRELEKLNRPVGLDQFGPYARVVDV